MMTMIGGCKSKKRYIGKCNLIIKIKRGDEDLPAIARHEEQQQYLVSLPNFTPKKNLGPPL
jgi:hypothetical protein